MKRFWKYAITAALLGSAAVTVSAQSFVWKAGAYTFFDNWEVRPIDDRYSQTMSGFRFSIEDGFRYKDFSLYLGVHIQTEFGSPEILDYGGFTGYFQYNTDGPHYAAQAAKGNTRKVHHHFLMGSFPRYFNNENASSYTTDFIGGSCLNLLEDYSTFYIRDSFNHYRPNIMGIYYKLSGASEASADNWLKFWLDWTGHQSPTVRETFYVGLSGQYRYKYLVAAFNAYYYHYAHTRPNSGDGRLHDNGLGQIGLGFDFSNTAPRLYKMRFTANFMTGYECKRDGVTPVKMPMGLVLDLHAQYWRIGTRTLYYYGQPRFTVPTDNFSMTYWGEPFLASDSYLQSSWYITLFKNNFVEAQAACILHLRGTGSEAKFGTQQLVRLTVNLNGGVHSKRTVEEENLERSTFNFVGAELQHSSLDDFKRRNR